MIVVDASVLIAFLDSNDGHHSAAVDLLEHAVPPLIVHPITAAEVLVAPTRKGVAEQVLSDLVAIGVEIDDTSIDPLLLAKHRVESGLRLPDCCVVASSRAHQVPIASFDVRLRKHSG